MTQEELKSIIIEEILEVAPDIEDDEIEVNENIQRSLEIDSFDFLKILTAMYERVGIEVPEKDYSKVDTVEHMVEYFLKLIKIQ
ncbi:MAG: acyl carrier protein [Sulfurimonas sp.]|nr:acyl carrier protein [Sulfurimonas sp.]